ncbi:hypothetical protein [Streptomyces olivaceoviridis]|uniref:hypothetical protein n=1 Tax=Streptomyces olivaceoviridis TaxID=1921 RepID=UPI00167B3D72|nr:hypothetical protein [Streptomyces olivaceoviridis]
MTGTPAPSSPRGPPAIWPGSSRADSRRHTAGAAPSPGSHVTVSSQADAFPGAAARSYHSTRASSSRQPAGRAAYHRWKGSDRHTAKGDGPPAAGAVGAAAHGPQGRFGRAGQRALYRHPELLGEVQEIRHALGLRRCTRYRPT